eukprot:12399626-Karenia_brevis.AAC.1
MIKIQSNDFNIAKGKSMNQLLMGTDLIQYAKLWLNTTGIDFYGNPCEPYIMIWHRPSETWDELQLWQAVNGLPCIRIHMFKIAHDIVTKDLNQPKVVNPINIFVE